MVKSVTCSLASKTKREVFCFVMSTVVDPMGVGQSRSSKSGFSVSEIRLRVRSFLQGAPVRGPAWGEEMKNVLMIVVSLIIVWIVWGILSKVLFVTFGLAVQLALIALFCYAVYRVYKALSREKIKY